LYSSHFSQCRNDGWGGAVSVEIADTQITASDCAFSGCRAQ
jgi:hypothetical protein